MVSAMLFANAFCFCLLSGETLTIPLEAVLQAEELSKRRVVGQLSQPLWIFMLLAYGRGGLMSSMPVPGYWLCLAVAEADVRENALDLAQAFANLGRVF
jgi:hypothetical protein